MSRRLPAIAAAFTTLSAVSAMPGLADVTADEVWKEWQGIYAGYGIALRAAQETRAGNILTLGEVEAAITGPEGGFRALASEIRMEERRDGSVVVTFTPTSRIEFTATPEDAEAIEIDLVLEQPDNVMIVTDAGDGRDYSYTVPKATLSLDTFLVDGVRIPATLKAEFEDLAETGHIGPLTGGVRNVRTRSSTSRTTFRFTAEDPEGKDGHVEADGIITGLRAEFDGQVPARAEVTLRAMQAAGLRMSQAVEHDGAEYHVTGDGPDGAFAITLGSGGAAFRQDLGADRMATHWESRGVRVEMSGADIPFPTVALGASELSFDLSFPTAPKQEPSGFGLFIGLRGVTLDDVLWSVFDPAGQLPRDPANVIVDVAGTGRLLADVLDDPAALEAGKSPAEIHSLEIRNFELSAAGARLTGAGAFTFRYENAGPPVPVGHVDLNLEGGNTLLDTLVSIGLMPDDQAMGMRMMMGAFARPGDGEDTLTSRIEATEDGGIVANGMRMR